MDSIKICNLALMMVGIPPITSFEENNNNARLCKEFFPVLRDRVLRDHPWSFATTSYHLQKLHEESFDPALPFVCALPGDVIRILSLSDASPYRRVGKKIFIQNFPASVIYVRRIEDPGLFDETFCEALQYLIASEIGMANTRDASLIHFYRQKYEKSLASARAVDSQENRFSLQNRPRRSSWIESRGPGCGGRRKGDGISLSSNFVEGTEGKQEQ